jgi:uncharacterized cupin superfamily protein
MREPGALPRRTDAGAAEGDLFYVMEGTMSVLVGDRWVDVREGAFVMVPGGMRRDFENRASRRADVLNFSIPRRLREGHAGNRPVVRRASPEGRLSRSARVAEVRLEPSSR